MRFSRLVIGIFFLLISASSFSINFTGQTPKVLPLGDSITSGRFEPSYRHKLKLLTDASSTVNLDFIGTLDSLGPPVGFADLQHEGWSGRTAHDILNEVHPDSTTGQSIIDHALATLETPDIALVHLGTNNLLFTFPNINLNSIITDAVNDLNDIVAKLRAKNPNMVILIAQIIPIATDSPNSIPEFESGAPNIPPYNVAIAQLVRDLNTTSSPVITVDQFTGFQQAVDLLSDGIHPAVSGEQKIAQQWFNALEPFFVASGSTTASASWPLNENTGTLAHDQSSNGIDLTINNGAIWVPGQQGSALDFNGFDQNASISNATTLQTPSITISAWINPDTTSLSQEWIAAQADNYGLYITPNSGRLAFYIRDIHGGWTDVFSSNNSIQFNQWQHVVGSYDAPTKTMKVFVDDVLVGSHTLGDGILYDTGNGFTIASMTNQRFFDGGIDEVQVFNLALTPAEIASSGPIDSAPVITPIGANPVTIQLGDVYTDAGATATDVEDGALTPTVDLSTVNTAVAGTYYVHFTATDSAGNVANVARSVIVAEAPLSPIITSPSPNSQLTRSSQVFTWDWNYQGNTVVEQWALLAGSTIGGSEYFVTGSFGDSTTTVVRGLPTDGSTINIRLWYKVNGIWDSVDATYTSTLPEVTSPVPNSTLASSVVTFEWDYHGRTIQQWALLAGSTVGGSEYFVTGAFDNSTATVASGLPTDGSTVNIRLWYKVYGIWDSVDTTYVAATLTQFPLPEITNPAPNSTLASSVVTFEWDYHGRTIEQWALMVGNTIGGSEYSVTGAVDNATTTIAYNLPSDGSTVNVRLWYKEDGVWHSVDTTYTALNGI